MRICPSCGTACADSAHFCSACGTRLDDVPVTFGKDENTAAVRKENSETKYLDIEGWKKVTNDTEENSVSDVEIEKQVQEGQTEEYSENEDFNKDNEEQEYSDTDKIDTDAFKELSYDSNPDNTDMDDSYLNDADMYDSDLDDADMDDSYLNDADMDDSDLDDMDIDEYDLDDPEEGRSLQGRIKAVIIESGILVVLIVLFIAAGSNRSSAEKAAEKYINACMQRDWTTAYSMLDISDGRFTQLSGFEDTMERTMPDIVDYTIKRGESSGSRSVRNFNVEYSTADQDNQEYQVSMVRHDDGIIPFLDSWKVSAEGTLINDFTISVPEGAQAAVDNIELTKEYCTISGVNGMDTYEIPLFGGTHTVTAAVPWCEVYEENFDSRSENSLTVTDFTLTDNGCSALQAKMQEVLQGFYTSAEAGEDYSKVEGYFAESVKGDFTDLYNSLVKNLEEMQSDSDILDQITFSNFRCDFSVKDGQISADMKFDYAVDYTHSSQILFITKEEKETDSGSSVMTASFVYEDGTYKIQDLSIPQVWQ